MIPANAIPAMLCDVSNLIRRSPSNTHYRFTRLRFRRTKTRTGAPERPGPQVTKAPSGLAAFAAFLADGGHVLAILGDLLATLLTDGGHVLAILRDFCASPAADLSHVSLILGHFGAALST